MQNQLQQVEESCAYIHQIIGTFKSDVAIVLGTGLGQLTDDMEIQYRIAYEEIPHFPVSTVPSHHGELVFGALEGKPVVVMRGRFHYYEGYSMQQLTFPIRVLKFLGVEKIIKSNAVGSIVAHFPAGEIVLIRDHINLHVENPLRGVNVPTFGPRFPDMSKPYDLTLRKLAKQIGRSQGLKLEEAVYAGIQGPSLETPAESRYLNIIGGEVVGMSTIPEVLVARHMGMAVLVLSVVTNQNYPFDNISETTLEGVLKVAKQCTPKLTALVKEILKSIN